jgi:uncharacterized small protein (DUF1192 family)
MALPVVKVRMVLFLWIKFFEARLRPYVCSRHQYRADEQKLRARTHRDSRRQILQGSIDRLVHFRVEEATAALSGVGEIEYRIGILQWLA